MWRWLLVVPAAIAAWYVVFVTGLLTHGAVEELLCPRGQMESGMCTNQRVLSILEVLIHGFVGLSALAVETAAALTAPSRKQFVVWMAFVSGSAAAIFFGTTAGAYGLMATALTAGLIGAVLINRKVRVPLLLLIAIPAFAKRTSDYVPPAYALRVAQSFATLLVFALPLVVLIILASRRSRFGRQQRIARALAVAIAIVFLGAAVAATDAMNDELWNPAFYGGAFVAASLPAGVAVAAAKEDPRRTSMIVLAVIAAFPLALLMIGVGPTLVLWAYEHGVPATW